MRFLTQGLCKGVGAKSLFFGSVLGGAMLCLAQPNVSFADYVFTNHHFISNPKESKITLKCKDDCCLDFSVDIDGDEYIDSTNQEAFADFMDSQRYKTYYITRENAKEIWDSTPTKHKGIDRPLNSLFIMVSTPFVSIVDTVVTVGSIARNKRYKKISNLIKEADLEEDHTMALPVLLYDDFVWIIKNKTL